MGLFDLFKRKPKVDVKDVLERSAVSRETLGKLLKALDDAASALPECGFDAATTAQYEEKIDEIRNEIKGISQASAPSTLPNALRQMFEKSLLKVLLYGDEAQKDQLFTIISAGIRALTSSNIKTQQLAAIDLNIENVSAEKWATDFQREKAKAKYQAERSKHPGVADYDLPGDIQKIAISIQNYKNYIATLNAQLATLSNHKNNIVQNNVAANIGELIELLHDLDATLPAEGELINRSRAIKEEKQRLDANTNASVEMWKQELGGLDDVYAEMNEEAKARQKQQEQQEAPSETSQAKTSETSETSEGVILPYSKAGM